MSDQGWHRFVCRVTGLTTLGDTGDFFSLIGGTTPWRFIGLRVWQRGSTTLFMDAIRIHRGVAGGITGTPTEHKYGTSGPVATVTASQLPTVDVGTDDLDVGVGWNILQEAVWMPTPKEWIPCQASDDIGIAKEGTTGHTLVGVTAVWEEYIGS